MDDAMGSLELIVKRKRRERKKRGRKSERLKTKVAHERSETKRRREKE